MKEKCFTPLKKVIREQNSLMGFTLLELIVVVIILAVLVSIGLPIYRKTVLKSHDQEAWAMLLLIQHGEKVYKLEHNTYAKCTGNCNTVLNLDIVSDYWQYSVPSADKDSFCALAEHSGQDAKKWSIRHNDTKPQEKDCP